MAGRSQVASVDFAHWGPVPYPIWKSPSEKFAVQDTLAQPKKTRTGHRSERWPSMIDPLDLPLLHRLPPEPSVAGGASCAAMP